MLVLSRGQPGLAGSSGIQLVNTMIGNVEKLAAGQFTTLPEAEAFYQGILRNTASSLIIV